MSLQTSTNPHSHKYDVVLQYRKIFIFNFSDINSSVSMVTRTQSERPDGRASIPEKSRIFLQYDVETVTGTKPAPYAVAPDPFASETKRPGHKATPPQERQVSKWTSVPTL
jgi:hypothetical protein